MVKNKDIDIWNNKSNDKIGSTSRRESQINRQKRKVAALAIGKKSTNV
jgi:hypothetical protein